jgi:hypothetical protein
MPHCSLWTNLKIEKPKDEWNTTLFGKDGCLWVSEIVKVSSSDPKKQIETNFN